jgi:hypothetical protein
MICCLVALFIFTLDKIAFHKLRQSLLVFSPKKNKQNLTKFVLVKNGKQSCDNIVTNKL